jgi:hypothetical protein
MDGTEGEEIAVGGGRVRRPGRIGLGEGGEGQPVILIVPEDIALPRLVTALLVERQVVVGPGGDVVKKLRRGREVRRDELRQAAGGLRC